MGCINKKEKVLYWLFLLTLYSEKKKQKRKQKEIMHQIVARKRQNLSIDDLLDTRRTKYDAHGEVVFKSPFFENSSESSENEHITLNALLENLLSMKRLTRKLYLINRQRMRILAKLNKLKNK